MPGRAPPLEPFYDSYVAGIAFAGAHRRPEVIAEAARRLAGLD